MPARLIQRPDGHVPPAARAALWLAFALGVAYAAALVPGVPLGPAALWETAVSPVFYLALVVAAGLRAAWVPAERGAWALLCLGLLLSWVANVGFALTYGGETEPAHSIFDVLWIASYPCTYAAMALLVRGRVERFHPSMWLDGLVSGLAVAGLMAALVFDSLISLGGAAPLAVAVNLAYPAADLLLVLLLVGAFAAMGGRPDPALRRLMAGLVVYCLADTLFLLHAASGTGEAPAWLALLYLPGTLLAALAAWAPRPEVRTRARLDDWPALFVPAVSTVIAACVLAHSALVGGHEVATALCLAALLSSVGRTVLTLRELRDLALSRREARTDELTGLPNRRSFLERLARELDAEHPLAVLLIDLDGFKDLNDTFGHHVGDALLADVGKRLGGALRRDDHLARLGGDEFAAILPGHADGDSALGAARRLVASLEAPFDIEGIPVRVEASVGICLAPNRSTSAFDALRHADVAMYQAKADRSEVALYDAGRDDHSRDRLADVAALRTGIEAGELVLHYQPQMDLRTGELAGLEALVRWQHPERGLLGPGAFLPAVEQTSFMRPLTEHLIREALAQAVRWRGTPLEAPIAVNLAGPNLLDLSFPGRVQGLLEASGLPAGALRLEVTENAVLIDVDRASRVLSELDALGVALSVDDFGTGLSSLGRLRHLPVDELKIDRSFVLGIGTQDADAAVIEVAITLAGRLGMRLVAEGIETQAVQDRLRELGATIGQGYHLRRPLGAAELEALGPFEQREPVGVGELR